MERNVLIDVRVDPCGCRWRLWTEVADDRTWLLHVGPTCEGCSALQLRLIEQLYPGIQMNYVD